MLELGNVELDDSPAGNDLVAREGLLDGADDGERGVAVEHDLGLLGVGVGHGGPGVGADEELGNPASVGELGHGVPASLDELELRGVGVELMPGDGVVERANGAAVARAERRPYVDELLELLAVHRLGAGSLLEVAGRDLVAGEAERGLVEALRDGDDAPRGPEDARRRAEELDDVLGLEELAVEVDVLRRPEHLAHVVILGGDVGGGEPGERRGEADGGASGRGVARGDRGVGLAVEEEIVGDVGEEELAGDGRVGAEEPRRTGNLALDPLVDLPRPGVLAEREARHEASDEISRPRDGRDLEGAEARNRSAVDLIVADGTASGRREGTDSGGGAGGTTEEGHPPLTVASRWTHFY